MPVVGDLVNGDPEVNTAMGGFFKIADVGGYVPYMVAWTTRVLSSCSRFEEDESNGVH